VHIATHTANGQNISARIKMVKGLLFYGIQVNSSNLTISLRKKRTPDISPDTTNSKLSIADQTMMRA
jgi:hypothetical protein